MPCIRLHPSGRDVPLEDGDTVLQALERAGHALPNNCRAGACGECKVKVRAGQFDQGMVLDMALSQAERKAGYGLMCMAKPLSEVLEIEWGDASAQPKLFPPREHMPYIVVDRAQRTPRICELTLRPLDKPLRYWPGQYVLVGDAPAGIPPRCYSIANAPRADGDVTLQIARAEGGRTSMWLHDKVKLGDQLLISGAYGTFIGDPTTDTPVLCLAAGTGLAPLQALADAALRRGFSQPVTLLFSGRTRDDVYDQGVMAYWRAKHPNFRFLVTLTGAGETGLDAFGGLTGRAPAVLPSLFGDLSAHSVYIAGSPGFVDDCVAAVKRLGAPADRIHTEGYFSQTPVM